MYERKPQTANNKAITFTQWRSQRGARGAPAPLTPPKISYSNLKGLTQEKGRKKMTP